METIDQNWYSSEAQRAEREKAQQALKEMKEQEKLCMKFRAVIIEKTQYGGIRRKYIKKCRQA